MSGRDYYGVGLADTLQRVRTGPARNEAAQLVALVVVYLLGVVTGVVL